MPRNATAIFLNTQPWYYRRGESAKIIGVRMAKPRGCEWRPCYVLEFADGEQDLVPIYEPDTPKMVVPACNMNWED